MHVLAFHNRIREKVAIGDLEGFDSASDMRQLTWSPTLEESATLWAEQCRGNESDNCRKIPQFPNVGQNVWTKCSPSTYPELPTILDELFSSKEGVTSEMIKVYEKDMKIDHKSHRLFTQIIWANTYRLGCGVVTYESVNKTPIILCTAFVCNYAPAGNVVNKPVYLPGTPGRNCPDLTAVRKSILTGRPYSVYHHLLADDCNIH
ncbi:hypothetical protein GE061_017150 [Apolygus lucorum]|uniref:SCP domain-containing protein n=1 Tax=Apolygus lucorum TaxID=248454 RepID=A0A8S9XI67_APOLU|nr:hypothetical protein GE061_017150 [Apolygus lucorum]